MNAVWFWTIGGMLIAYAVLDGYDLGVGALYLLAARNNRERRIALNAVGPVWNGNEVWLLAGGGMLVVSFPRVYAAGFSGFYLALVLVLWLLILRGLSIELRHQLDHEMWHSLWDAGFFLGSLLVSLLLGVALGNVLRGLPIGEDGNFQGTFALMLNPYSILTGLLSVAVLTWHGANYLRVKTEGELHERVLMWSRALWGAVVVLAVGATAATFGVSPTLNSGFHNHPVGWIFPGVALGGLALGFAGRNPSHDHLSFRASTVVIVGLLATAAITVYPNLLISTINPAFSLNIYNAASAPYSLKVAFLANIVGMVAVVIYHSYVHRIFRGKVRLTEHGY